MTDSFYNSTKSQGNLKEDNSDIELNIKYKN